MTSVRNLKMEDFARSFIRTSCPGLLSKSRATLAILLMARPLALDCQIVTSVGGPARRWGSRRDGIKKMSVHSDGSVSRGPVGPTLMDVPDAN